MKWKGGRLKVGVNGLDTWMSWEVEYVVASLREPFFPIETSSSECLPSMQDNQV